jgi:hypothetical protein
MKQLFYVFSLLALLVFSSCEEEALGPNLLSYDGDNLDAPQFLPGDYQMAARFPVSELQRFQGQLLEEIQVYIQDRPARAQIIVYGEGTANTPGPELYSANITTDLRRDQWNSHMLSTPIEISDQEIWLAIQVRHRDPMASVGCDPGPAVTNGDLMMDDNGNWTDLRAFTNNAIDINWNIRGVLSE